MKIFTEAANNFLQSTHSKGKAILGIEEISRSHSVRLLRIGGLNGEPEERFVIKIPYVGMMETNPLWIRLLQNEVSLQGTLERLGFQAKRFPLVHLNSEDPAQCFVISSYIAGTTFEEIDRATFISAVQLLGNYLFHLHSNTLSHVYGFLGGDEIPSRVGIGETNFLRADISRDGIRLGLDASRGLTMAMNLLDEQKQFCLCHCDVTSRNALWDGTNPHLIDWAYAHFTHPAHDIAHILFLLIEAGQWRIVTDEYRKAIKRYAFLDPPLKSILPFYLGQRYIEFGRLRGQRFIEQGLKLLELIGSEDQIETLFQEKQLQRG